MTSILFSKSLAMLKTSLLTKTLAEAQAAFQVHQKPFPTQSKLCGVCYTQFTCQSTGGLVQEIPAVFRGFFSYRQII